MSLDPVLLKQGFQGLPGLSHSLANLCRAQQALKIYASNASLSSCCSGQLTEGKHCSVQAQLRCMQGSPLLPWDYGVKGRKGYIPHLSYKRILIFTDRCCPLGGKILQQVNCSSHNFFDWLISLWIASSHTNHLETAFTEVSNLILQLLWVFWGGF